MINSSIKEDGSILGIINNLKDILLISFGAVLGVNTRLLIYKKLAKLNLSKDIIALIINTLASFFLGLFLSISSEISSLSLLDQLVLFISIGFLGCLITFSTFIYDLFDLNSKLKFFRAFNLYIISLTLGLLSLLFGLFIGS